MACSVRKANAPDLVRLQQLDATTWRLCFPGFTTVAVPSGVQFCAAGLSFPTDGAITSVNSISQFEESNSSSLSRFSWAEDSRIATNFNALKAGNWVGFFGRASGPIAAGIDHLICVEVNVKPNTTFAQLEATMRNSVLGTDDSNAVRGLRQTALSFVQPTIVQADDCSRNAKIRHNAKHTTRATRIKDTTENYVYSMQPEMFRLGEGAATGWRGVLQDEDASTSESVQLGFVNFAANGSAPDLSSNGMITNTKFTVFGSGQGREATIWTLTTATKMSLPRKSGIRLVLGQPAAWPTDGMTVHVQEGDETKIPADRRVTTLFGRTSSTPMQWLSAGSTVNFGGLYDAPVTQMFVRTDAYGADEDLTGPEAMHPDAGRGDRIGYQIEAAAFPKQFALIMAAPGYRAEAFDSSIGAVLIQNLVTSGVLALDANGIGQTPVVPIPAGVRLAAQSALLDFRTLTIRLSDATMIESIGAAR